MGDVWIEAEPHRCPLPDRESYPLGSIWQCDECLTFWRHRYTESSWGSVWDRVEWWNFKTRRLIRRLHRHLT